MAPTNGSCGVRVGAPTLNGRFVIDVGNGPVDPFVISDFQNGDYSINGEAKAFGDLWHQDLYWGTFDPANVVPGEGLHLTAGDGPVSTSELNAVLFPDGFTLVADFTQASGVKIEVTDIVTFEQEWFGIVAPYTVHNAISQYTPSGWGNTGSDFADDMAPHRLAMTVVPGAKIAMSLDGQPAVVTLDSTPVAPGLNLSLGFGLTFLATYFAFYVPQIDGSLHMLSELPG